MSNILVLGAGFVAAPLVKYLIKRNHQITVASQFLHEAQVIKDEFPEISINEVNVTDEDSLGSLVDKHDLTVSFIPAPFHIRVAKQCIKYAKNMITASYETPEMKSLQQQAIDSNITILNEIGLDPGIDHLSAMQIIDLIEAEGGTLDSFVSWCGGLPAPDSNNNPLGYKFAWAPLGVLMALLNEATYLKEGEVVTVTSAQLLKTLQEVTISPELELEGYPNRDSVSYRDIYGIRNAKEVLRGTLRYKGFSDILQCCKELGLLDDSPHQINSNQSWKALLEYQKSDLSDYLAEQKDDVVEALKWLGLLDDEHMMPESDSIINAFCHLLMAKLAYTEHEKDMVVLKHQFRSTNSHGETEFRESTLILEGDVKGYSAMAKTVGTPAAIAADLLVTGKITRKGVILPMTKDIYMPLLKALREEGIILVETLKVGSELT
ncbi:MAG: saccharopine dehydrogenase (NADP+, L-glutamate forming) [Enterobacterales bacterium]|jgi:saccharopine dehydrogenase (NADP+, L-glutamate forming)